MSFSETRTGLLGTDRGKREVEGWGLRGERGGKEKEEKEEA